MKEYDPKTCVTAGELRHAGLVITESIPDCAWVPRTALKFSQLSALSTEDGRIHLGANVAFDHPFQWIKITVNILDSRLSMENVEHDFEIISSTTPSGKQLFECKKCGRQTPAPVRGPCGKCPKCLEFLDSVGHAITCEGKSLFGEKSK